MASLEEELVQLRDLVARMEDERKRWNDAADKHLETLLEREKMLVQMYLGKNCRAEVKDLIFNMKKYHNHPPLRAIFEELTGDRLEELEG